MAEIADPSVAASILTLGGVQLMQVWNSNAPSLGEIRGAHPDDVSVRQRLHDADFLVGGWAVTMGLAFWILTGRTTALVVFMVMFGMVSSWHHSVMNAEAR